MISNIFIILIIILLILVLILTIEIITLINNKNSRDGKSCISTVKFSEYCLFSIRYIQEFNEEELKLYRKKFTYDDDLYHIDFDDLNWKNNIDLFIQTCLVTVSILSFYIDKNSIYYHDEEIWKMLIFTFRMLIQKMKNNNEIFFNSNHLYNIFTTFILNMYIQNDQRDYQLISDYVIEYMEFYNIRYYSEYDVKKNSIDERIFEKYASISKLCKNFNTKIQIN